mgnify:CR=1 FL=1
MRIAILIILFAVVSLELNAETMGGRSVTTTKQGVKTTIMYNLIIPDSLAKSQPDFDPLNDISMPLEKALHKAEVAYLKKIGNNYYKVKSVSLRPFHSNPKSWYYDIFIGQTRLAVLSSGKIVFEKEVKRN